MKLMQYKAIVCDVDGTILDGNHEIPDQLIQLVKQLQQQNILFSLASARATNSMLILAKELNLNVPFIALNGSLILDQNHNILYDQQFAFNKVEGVLARFPDVLINFYHHFDWLANRYDHNVIAEEGYVGLKARIHDSFPPSCNMLVLMADHQILLQIQSFILLNVPELDATFSQDEYLHITAQGIGKKSAVAELAKLYNLTLADFIAFGDGENDMAMLGAVGLGVAMGNAPDNVKAVAKDIADNHINLGVVKYLHKCQKNNLLKGVSHARNNSAIACGNESGQISPVI